MNAIMKIYGEWIYRVILLGAVCIGLYLNSRYVTREEFGLLQKQVTAMTTQIAVMVETNRINDLQDRSLSDHETRIRVLEARPTISISRPTP